MSTLSETRKGTLSETRKGNKSVSITMLTTSFPRIQGDYFGVFIYRLSKALKQMGNNIRIVAPSETGIKHVEERDGIIINRFQYFFPEKFQILAYGSGIPTNIRNSVMAKIQIPFFLLSFFFKTFFVLKSDSIIHAQWTFSGLVALILKKLLKKSYILTIYSAELFLGKAIPIIKYVMKNADYVIFISNYVKDKALELCLLPKYTVIPFGVDVFIFRPSPNKYFIHDKYGLSRKTKIIFALGMLVERKGFQYLIESMPSLLKNNNIHLIIGGEGRLYIKLKEQINALNLSKNVFIVGFIPDEELVNYYTSADIFILPSIVDSSGDTEGLGVVLLEAMACSCAVIASRVGGITDIIKDGYNGLLVEEKSSADIAMKVNDILNNPNLYNYLVKNAKITIYEKFSWDIIANKHVDIYKMFI